MSKKDFPSLKDLLEAGAHFGHVASRWNPKMSSYIFDTRNGVHIFDLVKTRDALEEACAYLEEKASEGKKIVFVGTKGQAAEVVKEQAKKLGIAYVSNRWIGGSITNWGQIKGRIKYLKEMREKTEKGEYKKYTKKEQVLLKREMERLERMYGGLTDLSDIPDVMFVVDPNREKTAVMEAKAKGVKIVAICDSNAEPDNIDYIIPANDDALKSVKLLVITVSKAVERGLKKKKK